MIKSSSDNLLRRIYRFLLLTLAFYALVTPLWWFSAPAYSAVVCRMGNLLFGGDRSSPQATIYSSQGNSIAIQMRFTFVNPGTDILRGSSSRHLVDGRLLHYNITIWIALILATPFGNWRAGLKILLLGWLIIFMGQIFSLYLQTLLEKSRALQDLESQGLYHLTITEQYFLSWGGAFFTRVGDKLLVIVLWLLLGLPRMSASRHRKVRGEKIEKSLPVAKGAI